MFVRDGEVKRLREASEDENERKARRYRPTNSQTKLQLQVCRDVAGATAKAAATRMHKDVMLACLSQPNLRLTSA